MQFNKTKFAKLESKKSLFLQTGFVVALAVVLFAFEWKTPIEQSDDWANLGVPIDIYEEDVVITRPKKPEPPPKPKVVQFKEVSNDEEVKDDFEVPDADANPDDIINIDIPEAPKDDEFVEVKDDDIPLRFPQKMPEFPGGYGELQKFLASNIHYPKLAIEAETQGTVHVKFVVEKDGSISNVLVLRGVGSGCDEEAVRVVSKMPNWIPGMQMNRPVRVEFNLPVKFTLMD